MTIGTFLRVLLRLLSWNILSLFGLCLILLGISSGQGQELLRLAHDHPGGVIRTLNTLLLPLLLFSTTCVCVGVVIGHAGASQLTMIAAETDAQVRNVLSLGRFVAPWFLGAIAFSVLALQLGGFAWFLKLSLAFAITVAVINRYAPRNWIRPLQKPKLAGFIALAVLLVATTWSVTCVHSPTFGRHVGTIGVAIVAISLWVNALSLIFVVLPLRHRLPNLVLVIPFLWFGISLLHDPNVWPRRRADAPKTQTADQRVSSSTILRALASYLSQYKSEASQKPIQLYLVSAEGGGIRAAYWTARTLAELNEHTEGQFSRHVFVYSGVSGGSLGITVFEDAAREDPDDPQQVRHNIEVFLGRDYLAPLINRLLVTEPLWQVLGRFSGVIPRDVAFERQLNSDWLNVSRSDFFARRFTDTYGVRVGSPRPIMALNATNVETGKRIIITNAAPTIVNTDFLMPLDLDEMRDTVGDVSVAEAVHLSARFPFVSPPASVQMTVSTKVGATTRLWGRAVDGGYFDNSAGLFIRDVFEELLQLRTYARRDQRVSQAGVDWDNMRPLVARLRFHVLVIRNDPTAVWGRQVDDYPTVVGEITRGSQPFDLSAALGNGLRISKIPRIARLSELLSPPETMLATRDARAAATRRSLWETVTRSSGDLGFQCEIEKRVLSGQPIKLPIGYSAQCVADNDDYQEISLADIALDNEHDDPGKRCASPPVESIALGWALSTESQETMSCLARNNQVLKDLEANFLSQNGQPQLK
jgi:predicted acylesterase/phospholipase RssA